MYVCRISATKYPYPYPYPFKQENYYPYPVMLDNPVPNSCDVICVTNNGSRSGNLYISLYQPFVFYLYIANSQNFT